VDIGAFEVSGNPIDIAEVFVRQHYLDFLNRQADPAGLAFWTDNITKCNDPNRRPANQTVDQCIDRQRETTSAAFFLSPEFQYTGDYVYRFYQGVLGRHPKLSEFMPDAQFVGSGIIVNGQLSGTQIEANKAAYAQQFVNCTDATKPRCAEFKGLYDSLTNQQYVDRLFATTGINISATDPSRTALVDGLNNNAETRATVAQKIVDGIKVIAEGNQQFQTPYGRDFYLKEFNAAFVLMEYLGYLRRDPDDPGYQHWKDKLDFYSTARVGNYGVYLTAEQGEYVTAEMVRAFIISPEYRQRFGPP
jgi:hypothetical protein